MFLHSLTFFLVFAYAMLSRLAYVLFVGWTLRREERERYYATRFGPVEGFRRFRRRAAWVMNHDAFAFILLCVVTRNTWALPFPPAATFVTGAALALIGLGTKLWAARTLGTDAYYWHNFFDPAAAVFHDELPFLTAVDPHLTLTGLRLIWEKNRR